jgi:Rap1a immunity proteins
MTRLILAFLLTLPLAAAAEEDGEELLGYMRKPATRELASNYIDAVWKEWNGGGLFCIPEGDRKAMAFDAVKAYLESHPDQLFRPRRYLIVQGLRGDYPCPAK